MRNFAIRSDITAPGGDYPDGRILDSNPPTAKNGTALEESSVGDLWQWMLKMMREAGIAENGLPDNETNGYQMYDALVNRIEALGTPDDSLATIKYQDRSVTFPKIEEIAESRIVGRNDGVGNGDMQELTAAQVLAMLGILSGSWTPTVVNNTPLVNGTPTVNAAKYQRIDNMVHFGINFEMTKTDQDALTDFTLSLPIASNFTNNNQGFGIVSGFASPSYVGYVRSENAADVLQIQLGGAEAVGVGTDDFRITGFYEIL